MTGVGGVLDVPGKQRELLHRDELCLEIARTIYLEEGYHSLTISRLARATGFSRPTLYDRFGSKEALIVELGLRCQRELLALLEQAGSFSGRTRERMVAIGEVFRHYSDRYADDMRISNFSGTDVVLEKVSADLRRRHCDLNRQIFARIHTIVEEAMEQGDLTLPVATSHALTFTLIAIVDGLASALRGSVPFRELGIQDPVGALIANVQVLFDGYGWRPLSSEWDYKATAQRAAATLIAAMGERHGVCD